MINIATKELNYLKDFLSWELLNTKKCYQYAQQETDQKAQQIFLNSAKVHQDNYMNLLNYVEQMNNQQNNINFPNMN
ncbi:hypothetical protein [Alkaliphilus peptidifermentans]|uniref:Coat F domain-containing protein n=1 Tax=Alkaliphilus peptidifermentans DSM 18978 TaxID=1120976 RepID=A0A1G5IZI4_9FIRM|nr:hypothetical protein [Alkaliphilus peptidifermentans]SCY81482.1 hypothetical protein SAMN03080606_02577 [Alkaliphilus peptidifermentans DSM 18978]